MLGLWTKLSYGMGHILNDLCAAMWFSYGLLYYNDVVGFTSTDSGVIILIGQVADALSTPLVGFLSDRGFRNPLMNAYGKRKFWHLIGTFCVAVCVPFMYSPCIECAGWTEWEKLLYYAVFVSLFQFGWAAVQISHLSLVPDLTHDETERTGLLSIRYTFTVISSMAVYLITWGVFTAAGDGEELGLSPKDAGKFQVICYTLVVIGFVTSILFHIGTKEDTDEPLLGQNSERPSRQSMEQLFSQLALYQTAGVYMSIRLFANVSQSIIPLYLDKVLHLKRQSLAIVPFVVYLSSFLVSFLNKPLNSGLGRKVTGVLGCLAGIGACSWAFFGTGQLFSDYLIYAVAALFGIASSILLVTSTAVTADLIGRDVLNGAFVYGVMSFIDKLSNGAALMSIQAFRPSGDSLYYKDILSWVCGGAAGACLLTLCSLGLKKSEITLATETNDVQPLMSHEDATEVPSNHSSLQH